MHVFVPAYNLSRKEHHQHHRDNYNNSNNTTSTPSPSPPAPTHHHTPPLPPLNTPTITTIKPHYHHHHHNTTSTNNSITLSLVSPRRRSLRPLQNQHCRQSCLLSRGFISVNTVLSPLPLSSFSSVFWEREGEE